MAWEAGKGLLDSFKNLGEGVQAIASRAKGPAGTIIDIPVNGVSSVINDGADRLKGDKRGGMLVAIVAAFAIGPALVKGVKSLFGMKPKDEAQIDQMIASKRAEAIQQMQVIGAGNGANIPQGYYEARYGNRSSNVSPTPR